MIVSFYDKLSEYVKTAAGKVARKVSGLIEAVEPFSPILIALIYFLCNRNFAGILYQADEFGYFSKLILLSGHDIVFPSWWRFGYAMFLLPVAWLTRTQSQFWFNFVIYQSLIWCATFYMVRRFITFLRPDITIARRFFVLLLCAAYPTWCVVTGYAFTTTVMVFFHMAIITLLCRWNGTSFGEPLAAAALAGVVYWVHPLALAIFIPLLFALFFGRKGSMKRCVVQMIAAVAIMVLFCVLYKIFSSIIDARMSDSVSSPMHYVSGWRKDIKYPVIPGMFFSHLSTLGLTTLGAGFCGLAAACHQMLGAFFRKIRSPLPERTTSISFFCALSVFAVAAVTALYSNCLHPKPQYWSYYHWVYCRYLENVSLPLLVFCFLVRWKAVYFWLPCVTLPVPYFGLNKYVTFIYDNPINVISLSVKNVCDSFNLLKGTERYLPTMHLLYTFVIVFLVGLFARFRPIKKIFLCLFLAVSVIGISHNLKRHDGLTFRAKKYREFVLATEKAPVKKRVTWDSFLQRNKRHICVFDQVYAFPRSAFWRAKWNFDTTENWLKKKEGLLITDFAGPLIRHGDLSVYRFPGVPNRYIAAKVPLPGCEPYTASVFWEKNRWIGAAQLLYRYVYPLPKRAFLPDKTGIFFSASPGSGYLRMKFSGPVRAAFFLNGKRIDSLTGDHSPDKCFDVSNALRQYNELTVKGPDALSALSSVTAVKLEDELTAESQYFTALSGAFRLHAAGKQKSPACNTLALPAGQTQYGPHVPLPPGTWRVEIRGKNLQQGAYAVQVSCWGRSLSREIAAAEISPDLVSYVFSHEQQTGRFEFLCRNKGKSDIVIENISLKSVRKNGEDSSRISKLPRMDSGFPFDRRIPFSHPDLVPFCYGFFPAVKDGRWAGKESSLEFCLAELPKKTVDLVFTLSPLTTDQIMIVKTPDGKHLKTFEAPCRGTYVLPLGREYFRQYGRSVKLDLFFPRATMRGKDRRKWSFFFKSLEARMSGDPRSLKMGQEVVFNKPSVFFLTGFSNPENWGTWSTAKNCVMQFSLPEDRRSETVHLRFTCEAYKKMKSVKIYCNGTYAASWDIRKRTPEVYDLKLRVPLFVQNVELRFEQFDVASPRSAAGRSDRRTLGLGFVSMKYLPAAAGGGEQAR